MKHYYETTYTLKRACKKAMVGDTVFLVDRLFFGLDNPPSLATHITTSPMLGGFLRRGLFLFVLNKRQKCLAN
ncbi:MAG: hypothetical protein BA873_01955 [Desulfobulbaceae bacterium C00003063]|nr:MAG: hypothetical protein BA873_01955 [Desulfobulbaceae bacterium C00003063]